MRKALAYYITAHGYGHGARSCDILNALHRADPTARIIVKTDLAEAFMRSRIPPEIELFEGTFDTGLIQHDSVRADLTASLEAISRLYDREDEIIEREAGFLLSEHVGVVVADIPAMPLASAQRVGIPTIATGNFGWDWIYGDYVKYDPLWQVYADKFRDVYAKTDLLLRQPFAEPMRAFPNRIDLPLLAKPGCNQRERIARLYGADPAKKWVLLSFTSLHLEADALARLARLAQHELFVVEPLEWKNTRVHCLTRSVAGFADILASMDVVVTKPGFGIVSECIANDKPIIYSERTDFLEYGILVDCIRRYCRQAFIPSRDLYAGELGRALAAIEVAPDPVDRIAAGGAELAARHIFDRLNATG